MQGFRTGHEGVTDDNNWQVSKAYNVLVALQVKLS